MVVVLVTLKATLNTIFTNHRNDSGILEAWMASLSSPTSLRTRSNAEAPSRSFPPRFTAGALK